MDYDADGDMDILSGSYTGQVYLFECTGGREFKQGVFLHNSDGGALTTKNSVTPELHDWDLDGDLDLWIGTRTSGVFVYENIGTRRNPVWRKEGYALHDSKGGKLEGSNAHRADWDGDGRLDLILGSERGEIRWSRNLGLDEQHKVIFAPMEVLVPASKSNPPKEGELPTEIGSRTKVFVTDWNGDGLPDLLAGDVSSSIKMLPPLTEAQEQEKAALMPEYERLRSEYYAALAEQNKAWSDTGKIPEPARQRVEETSAAFMPVAKRMHKFDREKYVTHGYPWLLLRKAPEVSDPAQSPQIVSEQSGPVHVALETAVDPRDPRMRSITLRMEIADGWHVYAQVPEGCEYPATMPGLTLPDGAKQVSTWQTLGTEILPAEPGKPSLYESEVSFTCKIQLADPEAAGEASVHFQVCDATVCMPPKTVSLPWGMTADSE
ncbi:MAG: FG-GAP-like repeat-containing protein [Planctomycetota bacterium]